VPIHYYTGCPKNTECVPKISEKSNFEVRHYAMPPPGGATENFISALCGCGAVAIGPAVFPDRSSYEAYQTTT